MFDDYLRVPINVSRDQGEQATSVIYRTPVTRCWLII